MTNTMSCARAVFTCRPNSHPFNDRSLPLDQPVKISRSVARARPNNNNAIFDCKVLSRNHALLWYETENGKRLSKSSKESLPRELCSGDIVQFGVDVMEVNKKLTHGCIIANVQLYLPDGKEAKASSSTIVPDKATSTPVQGIYLLNQYLKEAMLREQVLENKLAIIAKNVAGTKDQMKQNWKVLIEEDRLLTRVDILERQLQASHKSMTEDNIREELILSLQEKEKYQSVAKENILKIRQEKQVICVKCETAERLLREVETQKSTLEELCERNFKELKELAEKYEESEQSKNKLVDEMNLASQKYKTDNEALTVKVQEKDETLRKNKLLIQELATKMDLKEAKSILSAHNEDVSAIFRPTDPIIARESSPAPNNEDVNDNKLKTDGDLEILKRLLKNSETEKKEILAKLSQLLNLFEDLKTVSNKVQISEYVAELIGKLDIEIKQIKNFIKGDNNSYSINENVSAAVIKSDNHQEEKNKFEKLLEESRQTVRSLKSDKQASEQENEELRRQVTEFSFQIRNYITKVDDLDERNRQLSVDRESWEDEAQTLRSRNLDLKKELRIHERLIESQNLEVKMCQGPAGIPVAYVRTPRNANIADLKVETSVTAISEQLFEDKSAASRNQRGLHGDSSCITSPEAWSLLEKGVTQNQNCDERFPSAVDTSLASLNTSISSGQGQGMSILSAANESPNTSKILELEHELALYQKEYSEKSTKFADLQKKHVELTEEFATVRNQSVWENNRNFIICIIIMGLAIVLANFFPSKT